MEKDKAQERPYGPQLVFEERSLKCGYAPRTLLVSRFHQNTAFVGCKDGSVTVLSPSTRSTGSSSSSLLPLSEFEVHTPGGVSQVGAGAVRAVCEWDANHLLLARSGGSLEILRWREQRRNGKKTRSATLSSLPMDPVRYLVRMDDERIAVAYRDAGLHVLHRSQDSPGTLQEVGGKREKIRSIRAILPLRRGEESSTLWFLLTDRGDLYQWSGMPEDRPKRVDRIWEEGRRPSLISDSCLLQSEVARRDDRPAEELLIATDRGLYLLLIESPEIPHLRRLALSGLNATPMVLAYTSLMGSNQETRHEYLWVTDLQGDSHLFWSDGSKRFGERSFWRSGVHQARSETLACALLPQDREKPASGLQELPAAPPFFVVQVRRDDRIVLGRYWNPHETEPSASAGKPRNNLDLRELLNFGIYQGEKKAEAIRTYLRERFKEERQDEYEMPQDPKEKSWWNQNDAAIVAELFEYLAEDEDRRRVLLESLRAPYAETAKEVLSSGTEDSKDASRLWRLALLGILHRSPGDQTSSYLGLMRWLRHRQVELPKKGFEEISRRLDKDLLLVRKWGLRGGVNRDREDLVGPQRTLMAQEVLTQTTDQEELERLRWERLTYRAELFGRNISLIHENDKGRLRGRTAWATSVLPHAGGVLVAVSWMWGGVELFNLRDAGQGPELEFLSGDYGVDAAGSELHTLRRERLDPSKIVPAKYGYSRVVHLGKAGSQVYLLSAPASEPEEDNPEARDASLFVWLLQNPAEIAEEIRPHQKNLTGVGRASIYSLLDLGEGRLVAGLGGEGLQAALTLLEINIQDHGPKVTVHPRIRVPMAAATIRQGEEEGLRPDETRSPGRNRMWSLARLPEVSSDHFRIAFGCDSGEIYEVTINWQGKKLAESSPILIGRMGSPVQVVECRPPREDGVVRVFAGGEDGAIVAWQEISRELSADDELTAPKYGTLWATVEQGAISQIHCLEVEGNYAVLVVTREGRYVTFDDRNKIDSPPDPCHPSRVPMPGSRHGRRRLNSSAFASSLIETPCTLGPNWEKAAELGAFTALLVATNDGRIRLVSLHSPEAFKRRKLEFLDIVNLWHNVLQRPLDFRLTEAAYKASPALSLIVVRYLLDHRLDERHFSPGSSAGANTVQQALEESPWCLPRHLRPLLRLRVLWDRLHSGTASDAPENYILFESLLGAALDRAWSLNDLDLFQEICQVVLRQANSGLYRAVEESQRADDQAQARGERPRSTREVASKIFLSVLHAVEHSLPRWLSTDREREARARIAVAKHLVDGETARVLLREVAREEGMRSKQGADPLQPEARRESVRGPFGQVLDERIRAVRELVNKRHPLVSLESLRAANLSLARMCRSLVATRNRLCGSLDAYEPSKVDKNLGDCEVSWEVFQDYSDELITAAVRAFRTPLELNDALAHEFSRTFALFICACPSATLPIESLLTERLQISDPELEKGIFHRVFAQLGVLRAIGICAPLWAGELLRLGTQFPPDGWDWASRSERFPTLQRLEFFNYREGKDFPRSELAGCVGEENAENLGNIRKVYNIFLRLEVLIKNLETTARDLDLSQGWLDETLTDVTNLKSDHRQSKEFFENVFRGFRASDSWKGDLRKVRPETVRRSQELARWANDCLKEITTRAREGKLFQPEATTYPRVFRRLARAAEDFPTSAAVQTNVVQGVLGHHLLEDLDEHALELEEIAEVLNPRKVWDFRDQGRNSAALLTKDPGASTAEKFAIYLLGRASRAESIPKNLRMLQALLGSPEESDDDRKFADLVEPYQNPRNKEFAWKVSTKGDDGPVELSWHEARYLSLVLEELDQNQRKHAWPGDWLTEKPCPELAFLPTERKLMLRFPLAVEAETADEITLSTNIGRLRYLEKNGFSLIDPNRNPGVSSSGTGFYLADLAAAIANWRLSIKCPSRIREPRKPRVTWFEVTLAPYAEEKRSAVHP
jgi:hypothetical protein